MNMQVFDLHCHPFGKHFLTGEKLMDKVSPWKNIKGGILQPVAPILKSQSSLKQLQKGRASLTICGICPIEKGFSQLFLIKDLVGTFLALDKEFIGRINHGDYFSYNDLLESEIKFILHYQRASGGKINILSSIEDISNESQTLNIVLAIEGSHSLFTREYNELKDELIKLKNAQYGSYLYMTFTHLATNDVCNHAYGAKMVDENTFKPNVRVKGINPGYLHLIDVSYSRELGKRILIDIKHMSVASRLEFYEYRKNQGVSDVPILASHVAATGVSLARYADIVEIAVNVKELPQLVYINLKEIKGICGDGKNKNETQFNPWSINLFDEEITEIISSDGLIGVSLDQRILGFGKESGEYFRKDEFSEISGLSLDVIDDYSTISLSDIEEVDDWDGKEYIKPMLFNRKYIHLRYLCNNILHMIKVGGKQTWNHLCIGSDFDGLVDAINNCKNATKFPDLEKGLIYMLPKMANEDRGTDYFIDDITEQVRGIMYNNGHRFMSKYFTSSYLNKV